MIGFEIHLNGEKLHTVGIGDHGVLSSILTWADCRDGETESGHPAAEEGELRLSIEGLYSDSREHVEWSVPEVHFGDEVRIRIIDTESVDGPDKRKPHDPEKDLKAQQHYVREMAKRLGWAISESPTSRGSQ